MLPISNVKVIQHQQQQQQQQQITSGMLHYSSKVVICCIIVIWYYLFLHYPNFKKQLGEKKRSYQFYMLQLQCT